MTGHRLQPVRDAGVDRAGGLHRAQADECEQDPRDRPAFDPDVWFNNVEQVAGEVVGRETVDYVSNIYKYYVAYKLTIGAAP